MRLVVAFVLVLATAGVARADCFADLAQRKTPEGDLTNSELTDYGVKFMDDLRRCDEKLAIGVDLVGEHGASERQARIFTEQKRYVLVAYAIAWGFLAIACAAVFLRQQKLRTRLAELEGRLRREVEDAA
jgi:hypothetical protein